MTVRYIVKTYNFSYNIKLTTKKHPQYADVLYL